MKSGSHTAPEVLKRLYAILMILLGCLVLAQNGLAETLTFSPPFLEQPVVFHKPAGWTHQLANNQLLVSSPGGERWFEVWEVRGLTRDQVETYIQTYLTILYQEHSPAASPAVTSSRHGPVFQGWGSREGIAERYQGTVLSAQDSGFLFLISRSDRELPPLDITEILAGETQP